MISTSMTLRTRFETAHSLSKTRGKCRNIHGHSWHAWVTIIGDVDPRTGMLVDITGLKHALQAWIDEHLDHGMMIGSDDPLLHDLTRHGTRLYIFGADPYTEDLPAPTTECVAELIRRVASELAVRLPVRVSRVEVAETENNRATVVVMPTQLSGA